MSELSDKAMLDIAERDALSHRPLTRKAKGYTLDDAGYPIESPDDKRDAERWRALIHGVGNAGDVRVQTEAHQPHTPAIKGSMFVSVQFWSEREQPTYRYLSVCRLFEYVDSIIKGNKQRNG